MKIFIALVIGIVIGFYTYSLFDGEQKMDIPMITTQNAGGNEDVQGERNKWWDEVIFDGEKFVPSKITVNRYRMLGIHNLSKDTVLELQSDNENIDLSARTRYLEYVNAQMDYEGTFKLWPKDNPSIVLEVTVQKPQPSVAK